MKCLAQHEVARQQVALRNRIDMSGDAELLELLEERDMLKMNYEMTREIHGEWGALARKIAPTPGRPACDCDTCSISRALDALSEGDERTAPLGDATRPGVFGIPSRLAGETESPSESAS